MFTMEIAMVFFILVSISKFGIELMLDAKSDFGSHY